MNFSIRRTQGRYALDAGLRDCRRKNKVPPVRDDDASNLRLPAL